MKLPGMFLFCLLLTAVCSPPAKAVTITATGEWELGMGWAANPSFTGSRQEDGREDALGAAQRFRTQVRFVADETLSGTLGFEIGTITWGDNSPGDNGGRMGGGLDADGYEIKVRRAHIDWRPHEALALRMGIQIVALPGAAFGNPVLDTRLAGVTGNYTVTKNAGLSFFWLRPFARPTEGSQTPDERNRLTSMDLFGLTLPLAGAGGSLTPWGMYARNGNASGYWAFRADDEDSPLFQNGPLKASSNLWWAGTALELTALEPFSLKIDAMYGQAKGGDAPEFSGSLVAGLFEYLSSAAWGNPGLIAWHASGDDSGAATKGRNGKFGRMPIISADEEGFAPAAYGFPGSLGCMQDAILSDSGVGTWGLGLQLAELSFTENLTHVLRAVYIRGTNSPDMVTRGIAGGTVGRFGEPYAIMGDTVYMTTKDSVVEFDFLSSWAIHPNLTLHLETAYIVLNRDTATWGRTNADTANAWKAQVLVGYTF